jgi:uncharacterized protein YgiB involved in biofilm formation
MSAILGFGLASLFRAVCKDKNCFIQRAPSAEDVEGKTYKFADKCYSYEKTLQKCDTNMKSVSV